MQILEKNIKFLYEIRENFKVNENGEIFNFSRKLINSKMEIFNCYLFKKI